MSSKEFIDLGYSEQLRLINRSGVLKHSYMTAGYQYTLYKLKNFYVELKRKISELHFETVTTMNSDELPETYRSILKV